MKKETDTFIEKIKEEYGEKHSELPIPIIIAVTKWDDSPHFLADNELDEAIKYIEKNPILNDIRDKLLNFFKTVDIIPLSSEKNHNVTLPIQMALDYTFTSWETRIQEFKEKDDSENLIIYLKPLLYDLKFYKDGLYKKFYEDTEVKIAQNILAKLEHIDNLKEFNNYYDEYEEIIEALSEEHQEVVESKRNSLLLKRKIKQTIISLSVIATLGLSLFGYNKYKISATENLLYKNIKIEYTSHNYSDALDDMQRYYLTYKDVNKKHFDEVKLLEETTKDKFRKEIDKKIAQLKSITSLKKKFTILTDISMQVRKYDVSSVKQQMIQQDFTIVKQDKKAYEQAIDLISKMSIETINKDDIDTILADINQLSEYDEAALVEQRLHDKLKLIINASAETEDESVVETLINLGSTVTITQEQLAGLNDKLAELKLKSRINDFKDGLKNKDDIEAAIEYIAINWNDEYGESIKIDIQKIISVKFNSFLEERLKHSPDSIQRIDDYDKLSNFINTLNTVYKSATELPIKLVVKLDSESQAIYDKKYELYKKYQSLFTNGIKTSSIYFIADKNNGLGFSTNDDNLKIYIDGNYLYNWKNSQGAQLDNKHHRYIMQFSRTVTYSFGSHTINVTEHNLISDDGQMSGDFTISKNSLIKLYNNGQIEIPIDSIYSIFLIK